MKKLLLIMALLLSPVAASAQCSGVFTDGTVCGNATGVNNTPRMTPYNSFIPYVNLAQYHFFIGNASGKATDTALSGDCVYGALGIICTKTNGVVFAASATTDTTNASNITSGTLGYAEGGCNANSQTSCRNNVFPTPTRAGDLVYWNGSAWVTLPGNNSGTQVLQETSSGVPSWAAGGTGGGTQLRQAILSASLGSGGFANFLSGGSGLAINLAATTTPMYMSFAAGYSTSGSTDFVGVISADQTSYWSSLASTNLTFLSIDRNAGTGALTATKTLLPPENGPAFDPTRYALLQFANNATDDYGNTWTNTNGTYDNTSKTVGTWSWKGNGTSAYFSSTAITNIGQGNWEIEFDVNIPTLANGIPLFTANVDGTLVAQFGILLQVVGSSPYHLNWLLSSNGTSWDIENGTGATNLSTNVSNHIKMNYDGTTYRLFLNGTLELSVASALPIVSPIQIMAIGRFSTAFANAYFGQFRFSPAARNTSNFTPPSTIYTADGDWFNTNAMVMNTITGAGPTFAAIQRLYVGQAQTGSSTVSAVYSYNPQTMYQGQQSATNSSTIRIGKRVYYKSGSQFIITGGSTTPTQYILSPTLVPPDATEFYIQLSFARYPYVVNAGVGGQDVAFLVSLPGTVIQYNLLGQRASNGIAVSGASPRDELGGLGNIVVPVINGVAAFTGHYVGNSTMDVTVQLVGYKLP